MNKSNIHYTCVIMSLILLTMGLNSIPASAEQTYTIVLNPGLTNTWPGTDGLIGNADDVVDASNSPLQDSLPNANGSYSYNAFDFGGPTETDLLPAGMNAVTFLEGSVSIDQEVAINGGGALIEGFTVTGTEPFAGHGDYDATATASSGGTYDPVTGEFTQTLDFSATLIGGTASASDFELSGIAHVISSADYGAGIGNAYVDDVLIPFAQSQGALGLVYINASGVVPASSGGSGGAFPSMPVKFVYVALLKNPDPWTGLWWNASEDGWGVTLTEQVDIIFATLFTYDTSGIPKWYVASNCVIAGNGCSGDLYEVSGGTPITTDWDGSGKQVVDVGDVSFTFTDNNTGTMDFTINGVSGSKAITRQVWRALSPGAPMTALWWNSNEDGWGVTLTQQTDVAFATMFTYDTNGLPTWYVVSNCVITGNSCTGDLYSVTGGSALTQTWNGANKKVTPVGEITFNFSDRDNGTMDISIDGLTGDRIVMRQIWALDDDGDGINNNKDNCVNTANADQADSDDNGVGDVCDVDFAEVQQIFDANCVICHGTNGGLSLEADVSFDNLVRVPSNGMMGFDRVDPSFPDSSFMIMKLEGMAGLTLHPPTGALPSSEIQIIRNWITSLPDDADGDEDN